jgi:hypothetical protein
MRFVVRLIFIGFTVIISACSSGPGEDEFAPKIGDIDTVITHHYSNNSEEYTLSFTVRARISDPDGLDDITGVYVYDRNNEDNTDRYRILKDRSELSSATDCFQEMEIIECTFYPKEQLHDLELDGYELVAVDRHSYSSRKAFEFKLPAGVEVTNEKFVYSDMSVNNNEDFGVPALEVMTIADNNLEFVLDTQTESLQIEFTSKNDVRVKEYAISIYDDSSEPVLISTIKFDSEIIQTAEVVSGNPTVLNIPTENLEIKESYTALDIGGLYITLLDQPSTSTLQEVSGNWFNYKGISEFVPVTLEQ